MSVIVEKIESMLTSEYSAQNYLELMQEIFDGMQIVAPNSPKKEYSNFSSHIETYTHVGTYNTPDKKKIIIMAVELKHRPCSNFSVKAS